MTKEDEQKKSVENRIELSPPWINKFSRGNVAIQRNVCNGAILSSSETAKLFIESRSEVHKSYIEQKNKNKRLGMILAFAMIVFSTLCLIFAPEGRETLSHWIGGALIIFSAGALGYGRVWGKASAISFGADQDKRPL